MKEKAGFPTQVQRSLASPQLRLFAANLLILWSGEALSRGLTAIAFIHLARILLPSNYGQIELALAVMMLLTVVIDQGLGPLGTREIARRPEETASIVSRVVSIQIVLAGLVFGLLAAVVFLLPLDATLSFLLLGYGVTLFGYPFILNWVFQAWKQMKWATLPQVLRQAVFAVVVLAVIRRPDQVRLLAGIELLSIVLAVLANLAAYLKTGRRITIDLGAAHGSQLLHASLPIGGSQLIWAVRMYLPTVFLGLLAGQVAVGLFAAPHRLIMVGQGMLAIYFTNIFPYMSQISYTSHQGFARLLQNSLRLLIWPCLTLALATTFIAPTLIALVYGETYQQRETITVLSVLVWLFPILAWRGHSRHALIAMNRQGVELLASLATVILLLIALFPAISFWGPVGVAWAMVASELAGAALTWRQLKQNLPGLGLFRSLSFLPLPAEKP